MSWLLVVARRSLPLPSSLARNFAFGASSSDGDLKGLRRLLQA